MRTQWTTKGNRDAGSSCSCDRGLHRYLRNFGGGGMVWTPQTPLGTPLQHTLTPWFTNTYYCHSDQMRANTHFITRKPRRYFTEIL